MSRIGQFPGRNAFAVLGIVVAVASPFAIEARAVDGVHRATAVIGAAAPRSTPASPSCDPQSGPVVWSRFSGIGSIHLGTGSYVIETIDIGNSTRSSGMARTFTRNYDSGDFRRTSLGPGWMHNFAVRLRHDEASPRDLLFTLPSGSFERFKNGLDSKRTFGNGSGYRVLTWDSAFGPYVVSDGPTTWTLDSTGSLVRGDDGAGDWLKVTYENGHPTGSTGPDGPGLRFEIDAGNRLTRVVDAADDTRFVDYEFDGTGRLIRAAPSGQPARVYAYDGSSERIATISDDEGAILEAVGYDDRGWVIRQQDAQGLRDGEAVIFVYEDLPDGTRRTTVTYPPSLIEPSWHPVQIATHDARGRVLEVTYQGTSTQTLIGRYGYDAENRQIVLQDPCASVATAESPVRFLESIWLVIQALLSAF